MLVLHKIYPKGIYLPGSETAPIPPLPDFSYPVAAKLSSSKIPSKSDVGGVRLGLKDGDALTKAVRELLHIENAEGVYVEEMAAPGFELIVGGSIDGQFGPVVMVGLGGIFVEFFRDVVFALAPLTREGALDLLRRLKGYRLFENFRGRPALDLDAILQIVVVVSELIGSGLIAEIDLNPVVVYRQGTMILDAKMKVKSA